MADLCRFTRESIHFAGAIDSLEPGLLPGGAIRFQRLIEPIGGVYGRRCSCERARNRVTVDGVVVARSSAGAVFAGAPPIPDGLLQTTARSVPYVKVRLQSCSDPSGNCGPGGFRPAWIDFGQSIIVPWRYVSVSLVGPPGWSEVDRPNKQYPPVVPGPHVRYDVFANIMIECTDCCERSCALLTDTQLGAAEPAGEASFIVPPYAGALTFTTTGAGPLSAQFIDASGGFVMGAFTSDLGRAVSIPQVPDSSLLFVSVGGVNAIHSAAWEICL